jgi:hypothetical protein
MLPNLLSAYRRYAERQCGWNTDLANEDWREIYPAQVAFHVSLVDLLAEVVDIMDGGDEVYGREIFWARGIVVIAMDGEDWKADIHVGILGVVHTGLHQAG